jgi:hypothetical protein
MDRRQEAGKSEKAVEKKAAMRGELSLSHPTTSSLLLYSIQHVPVHFLYFLIELRVRTQKRAKFEFICVCVQVCVKESELSMWV